MARVPHGGVVFRLDGGGAMNRASFVGIVVLIACTVVAGCAQQQQTKKMETALTPYVARSIADFALDHGPPTGTIDMGAGKRGFQWVITGQSAGAVVPISGMLATVPPQQQVCTVSLVASTAKPTPSLSDWIIESWRWNGAC
jgi:hypothetical protein